MSEKFNPAPTDKHAADPKQEMRRDKKQDDELERGLKDSFPASDPVSSTQPTKAAPNA
ncbi:hypothetical protein BjapCC829_26540 [Bradyrhizobium barranii]|jgi:hypothetical protein|uniref:Uncharacterized protein n=1 Tax=Bradyrhizobium barranii TaxID=2992140 RepID=A0ABY3QD16_9BRAD|nr:MULTISPECIES: hypothetical protein [Bradyrhizobium]UFW83518.1 hypothetical protein BjapCC829_26540 [Bradyrhizobium japonicum]